MRLNSINSKLLLIVTGALVASSACVILLATYYFGKIIDATQAQVYSKRVDEVLVQLERNYKELLDTLMVEAYEDQFKYSILSILRENYYRQEKLAIYPFIIDTQGIVIMHPRLKRGDKSVAKLGYVKKMIELKQGNFDYGFNGVPQWTTFKFFEKWRWIVGYAIPLDIKYADSRQFRYILSLIILLITILDLIVLSAVITRFTKPIVKLTQVSSAMATGNLDQQIDDSGRDELGILARSFAHMRDAIKKQIIELKTENAERKRAEEALRQSEERLSKINKCFLNFGVDPLVNINLLTMLCGELMGANYALYNRLDREMLCSWGQWNPPQGYKPTDKPDGHICYDLIKRAGDETLVVTNLSETRYAQTDPNVTLYKLKTYMGRAVKLRDTYVGSLCVVYQDDFVPSDADNRIIEIIAAAIGIEEERKWAEEVVRESEEITRSVLETSPVGISIYDETGQCLVANDSLAEMIGATREQVLQQNYNDLESWKISGALDKAKSAIKENISKRYEFIGESTFGRMVQLDCYLVPFASGRLLFMALDITERKRAEEALRESEKLYRLLADNVTDVLWVRDMNLHLNYVSPSITHQTGYTVEETMARTLEKVLTPDSLKFVEEVVAEELEIEKQEPKDLKRSRTIELKIKHKDGSSIWTEVRMSFLRDQLGNPTGIIGVTRDITDRKHLKSQLQQAQKMEAIGTLAGGIAHDFNNILGGIIGYTELAQSQISEDQPALARDLSEVLKAGDRAKDLVQQILAFSRQTDQKFKPVKMNLIVKEALKLLRASLPTTIEITQNIKSDATIWGDPTQLHQIIMNLCTNAFHAMRESGGVLGVQMDEVALNATALFHTTDLLPGRYIKLVVSDTGHGMDFNTLQRLFDPYFTTKEATEGTGLGLSVTHGIVKSHGGAINVESAPGDGSTFTILLPLIDQDTKEDRIEEIPIPKGSERILFVDDEELFYDLVKRLLEELGYEVVALQSSLETLKTFQARPDYFDLVITDQTMPKLTGVQLAAELIKIRPGIPIILCTGFSEQVSEKTAADFGISAFVMKPVNIRRLAETIRQVLDG